MIRRGRVGSSRSEPVLEESSSSAFIVAADELIVLAHGGPMRRKPAEGARAFPAAFIHKLQQSHLCVDVAWIPTPFLWRVEKVRARAPVYPTILHIPCRFYIFNS